MFAFSVPRTNGELLECTLEPGEIAFVVGANGSGKTRMLLHINSSAGGHLIPANRHNWMERPNIPRETNRSRDRNQSQLSSEGVQGETTIAKTLAQIVGEHFVQVNKVYETAKTGEGGKAVQISQEPTVFERIGSLVQKAGVTLTFTYQPTTHSSGDMATLQVSHKSERGDVHISPSFMSDGERSVFILASRTMTAPSGTTVLIDEPERHLHRAISERLMTALFKERPDCAFIISTHDTSLPMGFPNAKVIVTREYIASGPEWDAEVLEPGKNIPEDVKRVILGGRRQILVTEGTPERLDARLYSALFPDHLVYPVESCENVIHMVGGLEKAKPYHQIQAVGVIDRDARNDHEVELLASRNVYAISGYAVESLYFCPAATKAVAQWQAKTFDLETRNLLDEAKKAGVQALRVPGTAEYMASKACERKARHALQTQMPTAKAIREGLANIEVPSIDLQEELLQETDKFRKLSEQENEDGLAEIIECYPIKESELPDAIAKALHLNGKTDYADNLIARVKEDPLLRKTLLQSTGVPL